MALRRACHKFMRYNRLKIVLSNTASLQKRMLFCQYGFGTLQGRRSEMQDTIYHSSEFTVNNNEYSLFGVFDGHGHDSCAKFLTNNIESYLSKHMSTQSTYDAFTLTMNEMNKDFIQSNELHKYVNIGSTAVIALVDKNPQNHVIHVSNVGDSRCILVDDVSNNFAVTPLTIDHHPAVNQYEKERLLQLNNRHITEESISQHLYFGLSLAMSRCIGNAHLKKQNRNVYLSQPDVVTHKIAGCNDYLLLYSDGFTFEKAEIKDIFKLVHENQYDLDSGDLNALAQKLVGFAVNGTLNHGLDEHIGRFYMQLDEFCDNASHKQQFDQIYNHFNCDIKNIGRLVKICVFNVDDLRRFEVMEELLFPYENTVFDIVKQQFSYSNIMARIEQLNEENKVRFHSFVEWLDEAKHRKGWESIDDVSLIICKLN